MAEIHKKVWKENFEPLVSGKKEVKLCLADFEVHAGDTLLIREWDKDKKNIPVGRRRRWCWRFIKIRRIRSGGRNASTSSVFR